MGFWDFLFGKKRTARRDMSQTWGEYRDNPRRKKRRTQEVRLAHGTVSVRRVGDSQVRIIYLNDDPYRADSNKSIQQAAGMILGRKVSEPDSHLWSSTETGGEVTQTVRIVRDNPMHALPPRGKGGRFIKSRGRKMRGNPYAACDSDDALALQPPPRKPSKYASAEINLRRGPRAGRFKVAGCGIGRSSPVSYANRNSNTFAIQYLSESGENVGRVRYVPKSWLIGTMNRIRRTAEARTAAEKKAGKRKKGAEAARGSAAAEIMAGINRAVESRKSKRKKSATPVIAPEITPESRQLPAPATVMVSPDQQRVIDQIAIYRTKLEAAKAQGNERSAKQFSSLIAKMSAGLASQGIRLNPYRMPPMRRRMIAYGRMNPAYVIPVPRRGRSNPTSRAAARRGTKPSQRLLHARRMLEWRGPTRAGSPHGLDPNGPAYAALAQYAREHGPFWRLDLETDWYYSRRPGFLQNMRNDLGPEWLWKSDFEF